MNFQEAFEILKTGKKVRRGKVGCLLFHVETLDGREMLVRHGRIGVQDYLLPVAFTWEDLTSDDWEAVDDED